MIKTLIGYPRLNHEADQILVALILQFPFHHHHQLKGKPERVERCGPQNSDNAYVRIFRFYFQLLRIGDLGAGSQWTAQATLGASVRMGQRERNRQTANDTVDDRFNRGHIFF